MQLEQKKLTMKVVVNKYIMKLGECHKHVAEYEWMNHSHVLDLVISNPEMRHILCTDFAVMPHL